MKDSNPHSGIYEADTSRTLDLNGGSPACNQGGIAVVCIEGNGSRESHRGDGYIESDKMHTLNTVEKHAVCQTYQKVTGSLCASGYDKLGTQEAMNDMYVVQNVAYGVDCYNQTQSEEVTQPLRSINADSDHIPCVYGLDRASFNQGKNALYDFSVEEEKAQTLVSRGPGGVLTKQ
jgi:DNA (cytosine-5)-methyltransferase 1